MKKFYLSLFFCLMIASLKSQDVPFDSLEYVAPIKHPMKFSATFGELRYRHFHTGLDIKSSNGRIGDPIYAVADGWISRIRVEGGGYGQALYIDHPNGTRSVYAHLDRFIPEIEEIVKDSQYVYKSFAVDLSYPKDSLSINQGQKIGIMGNKGYSFGPHLHFEMRNAHNDVPYNPLLFPIPFNFHDTQAPVVGGLELAYLDHNLEIFHQEAIPLRRVGKDYAVNDVIKIPYNHRFSLSINTHDRQNGTHNKNGIYSIRLFKDSTLLQEIRMDSVPFEISHQIDAYIDYGKYKKDKQRYHMLTQLPNDSLPVYTLSPAVEFFMLKRDESAHYTIEVSDFKGNTSSIQFDVKGIEEGIALPKRPFNYHLYHDSANLVKLNDFAIYFPLHAMYRHSNIYLTEVIDKSALSPTLQIFNEDIPLNKAIDIKYKLSEDQLKANKKFFLARCNGKSVTNIGSEIRNDSIIGRSRSMGTFELKLDTIKPTIKTISAYKNPPAGYRYIFEIQDDIRSGRNARNLEMWAELNGKWYLGEEDTKTHRFYVPVPDKKEERLHVLKIYARDAMDNIAVKEIQFKY